MSRCSNLELTLELLMVVGVVLGSGLSTGAEARVVHKATHSSHSSVHTAATHRVSAHRVSAHRVSTHQVATHHGTTHASHTASTRTVSKTEKIVVIRHGRRHVITRVVKVREQSPPPIAHSVKVHEKSDVDDSQAQAQAAAEAQPRLRNYSLLGNAYALYDQGVNERLKGNYGLSTDKLTEAGKLIDQASSVERDGRPSTLQAMVFYELGLSAEADNELGLARDSFVHAVKAKPNYVEAYVHLVNVLALGGNIKQASNYLNDGLRECPNDGRLKALEKKLSGYSASD